MPVLVPAALIANQQSPYAGEERRLIKSLSEEEIRALKSGAGMGFAKLAELRARLRYVHLEAHLRQKELLTESRIQTYDEVRGYRGPAHDHDTHPQAHPRCALTISDLT